MGRDIARAGAKEMMQRRQYGLDGFLAFLQYFVMWRGLKNLRMFEPKITAILDVLETPCETLNSQNVCLNL